MNQLKEIVNGGYCIGCGACAAVSHKQIEIRGNDILQYQADIHDGISEEILAAALKVCPFSNEGLNEDGLSDRFFDKSCGAAGDVIGYYRSLYAGHASDDEIRAKTTSGGIITWTLLRLMERGLVDGVIHVKQTGKPGNLFEYGISRTAEEILAGAKSRYYPVEISKAMDVVKENEGRYVFVGLPCFVKAVRKLCINDLVLGERILFCIGLVCGHLKSKAFAEMLAWQAGLDPRKLAHIDFRYKLPDRPADNYGIRVEDADGNSKVLAARDCPGTSWGLGFFKYEACDYCDDIFSETADLAVGDAWLKQYTSDSKGNSVVITRNRVMDGIVRDGLDSGVLRLDELSPDEMRAAQGGGFRHRRSGLGYRLYLKQKKGRWAPRKRVPVNRHGVSFSRKPVMVFREYLRNRSSECWKRSRESEDYSEFERRMRLPGQVYSMLLKSEAFGKRIVRKIKRK